MNNYVFYLVLFTLTTSVVDFYNNKFYKKCWNKKSFKDKIILIALLIIHNVIYYCIYITLIFTLYYYKSIKIHHLYYYLFILIAVPTHWLTNGNQCYFTLEQNKMLGINKNYGFRDPYLIFTNTHASGAGSMTPRDYFYYIYLISAILITTYMIIKKKRIKIF